MGRFIMSLIISKNHWNLNRKIKKELFEPKQVIRLNFIAFQCGLPVDLVKISRTTTWQAS